MQNIAIVGPGEIGKTHARAIQKSDKIVLVAFVGKCIEKTTAVSDEFSVHAYTDLEELFKHESVDIVMICTPTYLHEQAVICCIEHKKHILCEKPFCLSLSVAKNLTEKAKKASVKMMVLQVLRFWPEYVEIKHRVAKGQLGEIKHVYLNRLSTHPKWSTWYTDPEKSGGALYDLHIHDVDYLYNLFGRVKSVYALGHKSNTGCYNTVTTTLVFECGTTATIECSMELTGDFPFTTQARFVGEKATLLFHSTARYDENAKRVKHKEFMIFEDGIEAQRIEVLSFDPYQRQVEYFVECLEENKEVDEIKMSDVTDVLKVLAEIKNSIEANL